MKKPGNISLSWLVDLSFDMTSKDIVFFSLCLAQKEKVYSCYFSLFVHSSGIIMGEDMELCLKINYFHLKKSTVIEIGLGIISYGVAIFIL